MFYSLAVSKFSIKLFIQKLFLPPLPQKMAVAHLYIGRRCGWTWLNCTSTG